MSELTLRTAIGSYGHTAALKDGSAASGLFQMTQIEVSPVTAIFRRMVRGLEFDVAEMALSTCLCARAHGKPFTALPVFLTRAFYHGGLAVRRGSGIASPQDLAGRRIGVRSYTLTPGVWTRGILQSEYGVDPASVTWVLSGDEHVAEFTPPSNVTPAAGAPNGNLAAMLRSGEIDAAIGAGPIPADDPEIAPLFSPADAEARDAAWHRQTGVYPVSHLLVARDDLLAAHPGLASELCRVFGDAKARYLKQLAASPGNADPDTDANADADAAQRRMAQLVGGDPLPYGLESSRRTLETFIGYNVAQGVIPHPVAPEELFPPETLAL